MFTIITTGSLLCRTIHLLECPICGNETAVSDSRFVFSTTIGDKILCCKKHDCELSAEQELKVQEALQKAMANPRGSVIQNGKIIKYSAAQMKRAKNDKEKSTRFDEEIS